MPLLITQICLLVVIACSLITARNTFKAIKALMDSINIVSKTLGIVIEQLNHQASANSLPTINPRPDWPTNCFSCGAFLRGGATQHKDGCVIKSLIEQRFPKAN